MMEMNKNNKLKQLITDPNYLELIRHRLHSLYSEYGRMAADNVPQFIKFKASVFNGFGNPATYQFGRKLEIH